MKTSKEIFDLAYNLALINLRNNYQDEGIFAGRSHFSDIWARDSLFASWGSLAVNDHRIVKRNLQTLAKFINKEGQIPLRVGQKYFLLKYFGIFLKNKARFREDKWSSIPVDQNSLWIITCAKYLKKTNDIAFIKNYFPKIQKIIDWNLSRDTDQDFLIEEGFYANWADSLKKRGNVLYTNVLWAKALQSFSEIAHKIGQIELSRAYKERSLAVIDIINRRFWEKTYYIDWIHRKKKYILSTDGNALAILYDIANKNQKEKIIKSIQNFSSKDDFCVKTNYPNYTFRDIYPPFIGLGLSKYHNGFHWLWVGCVLAVAKAKAGLRNQAITDLRKIAQKIIEYKGVYEVYYKEKPVKSFFYHTENGFAWSSGLFIWALKELGLK